MKRLEQRFLEAVDRAHNEFGIYLKFEAWVAAAGITTEKAEKLRTYLQARGIL